MSTPGHTPVGPVTVAVVTWNSADVLPGLVASLPVGAGDVPYRLVVVDNDSSDDTVAVAQRLCPDATVVQTGRNAGYAAGVNAAVAATPDAPAVLVLNPDVRLEPGCLPTLVAALDRPGTGIAVPRLVDGDGELIHSMRRHPTLLEGLRRRVHRRHRRRPVAGDRGARHRSRPLRRRRDAGLGRGIDPAGQPRLPGRLRAMGRVLLPLLRGDGVPPAGREKRVRRPLRRRRLRGPPRGRLLHLAPALGAPHRQPAAAVLAVVLPPADRPVLGGARPARVEPGGAGRRHRAGGRPRAGPPRAAARPSRARVARPRYPKSGTPPRSGPRRGRASVACSVGRRVGCSSPHSRSPGGGSGHGTRGL